MKHTQCPACQVYHWQGPNEPVHVCPPIWLVRWQESDRDHGHGPEDEFTEVRAHDAESAARAFACEQDAEVQYQLSRHGDTAFVRRQGQAEVVKVFIGAEYQIHFSVRQLP